VIYLYGAGGHGKVAFHTLIQQQKSVEAFIDDNARGRLCDLPILSPPEIQDLYPYAIHFAIGNNRIRQRLQTEWQRLGIVAETAIHPQALIKLPHIHPSALTANEAQYLLGFKTADEIRNRRTKATQEIHRQLRSKGIELAAGDDG
jgi:hypothetical protein